MESSTEKGNGVNKNPHLHDQTVTSQEFIIVTPHQTLQFALKKNISRKEINKDTETENDRSH